MTGIFTRFCPDCRSFSKTMLILTFSKRNPLGISRNEKLLHSCSLPLFIFRPLNFTNRLPLLPLHNWKDRSTIPQRHPQHICCVCLGLINNPCEFLSIGESYDWKIFFLHYYNMAPKVGAHVVVYTLMFGGTTLAAIGFSKTFSKSQGELDAELRAKYPELIKRSQDQKVHMQAFFDKVRQVSRLTWHHLFQYLSNSI